MGDLYQYTQDHISAESWAEVDRIFRFLEKAYAASLPRTEIENAVRVSFLEYFDFQNYEKRIRGLLGSQLAALYEDQMHYMADLARRGAEQAGRANRRPASPFHTWREFGRAVHAPWSSAAAVAHLTSF